MTADTTLRRVEVIAEMLAQLAAAPEMTGVSITAHHPGQNMPREAVWVYDTEGSLSCPFAQVGPKTIDDRFTVTVRFLSRTGGTDPAVPLARVQSYAAALVDVLRDDARLREQVPGVVTVLPEVLRGPFGSPATSGDPGWEAHAEMEIAAHVRTG